ncbi:MAG: EamA family transporter RarD [Actinocatenispora sp.]
MGNVRHGHLYGLVAYGMWGLLPIYLKLLQPSGSMDILANRILWSLVCCVLLLAVLRQWRWLASALRQPRTVATICVAALMIAINWGVYIYGVNSDHVIECALGYFINPLVSILLGVVVLRERMRAWQWVAVGIGGAAVVVITVDYGRPPWIALAVAGAFGCYGLAKKTLRLPAAHGLFAESAVLALPAVGYLLYLALVGHGTLGTVSTGHTALLVGAGVVTAIPLLCFAGAANRLPLTTIGTMQYVTPILQLGCGLVLFDEPMPPAELAGFALVWVALGIFTWDAVRHYRRRGPSARAATRESVPSGSS